MFLALVVFSALTISCSKPKSVLIVLSGVDYINGNDGQKHKTGYWLEEFSTPYKIFKQSGFKIVLATPNGNRPSADPSSIALGKDEKPLFWGSKEDYNEAMKIKEDVLDKAKIESLAELNKAGLDKYDAIFFPGGHAPMEDLVIDKNVADALKYFHEKGKTTALVCHGPIAILSTKNGGDFPYKGYKVSSFSNSEEKSSEVGKYLKTTPETALTEAGMIYSKGPDWQSYIVEDRELITGQNPASSKAIAEAVVKRVK